MIIFDEYQHAENLKNKDFKGFVPWKDLFILAKFYRYKGYSNSETRKELQEFCGNKIIDYNPFFYDDKIESALKKSKDRELKMPKEVIVTKAEIERIRSINNYRLEKILFVFLVVSKNNYSPDFSGTFYVNQNFSTMVSLAKVYMNKVERGQTKFLLKENGYLFCPGATQYNVSSGRECFIVPYVNNKSEEYLRVTDFSRIISFYRPLCERCGNEMEIRKRRRICDNCYEEKRKKDVANNVKNIRLKNVIR